MQRNPFTAPPVRILLLLIALLAWIPGCGTKQPPPVKWQDAMQTWFSNTSVSPDEPPRLLWTRQDEDLFLKRIGYADAVAIGTIRVVTLFSRFGRQIQLGVAFRPSEVLYGDLDEQLADDKELRFTLGPADLDFQLALRVQEHLPGAKYVLLLKRKPDPRQKKKKAPPVLRWALYRPDKRLLTEIRAMYQWLEKKDEAPPQDEDEEQKKAEQKKAEQKKAEQKKAEQK